MIDELDDKYKPMIAARIVFIYIFSTFIHVALALPAKGNNIESKDSLPSKIFMLDNTDTLFVGKNMADVNKWTATHLPAYWKKGYALARWELRPTANNQREIQYDFVQDKLITKGKITGWDPKIMDASLAPLILDWHVGKLLTAPDPKTHAEQYGIQIIKNELFFEDSIANIKINMIPSHNQYFDGILGLQQMEGKSVLVGDVKLNWINSFKKGESFYLRWQRQDLATQRLELDVAAPFIFHRSFGLSNHFDFYRKKDQVFQTVLKCQVLFHWRSNLDYSSGVELKNNQGLTLNNPSFSKHMLWVNTWRAESISLELAAGSRKLTKTQLDQTNVSHDRLYRWEAHWKPEFHHRSWVFQGHFLSMGYVAHQLEKAEMLRMGGPKNVRGFNTESIFVTQWYGFQTNWGYQLSNVLVFLYLDGGINDRLLLTQLHQAYGLGTKIIRQDIQISMDYGWGIFPGQSIDFRQGILNIGFNQAF